MDEERAADCLGLSKSVSAETLMRNRHNLRGFY